MARLPPLSAVRVFESAARHQNFTQAAAELGMTQAAVSYQIRLLEERLGTSLFARVKGRVSLTEAGRRIAPLVANAFETLDDAFSGLVAEDQALLVAQRRPDARHRLAGAAARRVPGPPPRSRGPAQHRQPAGRFLDRRIPRRDPGRARRLAGPQMPFPVPPELQPDLQRRTSSAAHGLEPGPEQLLDVPRLSPARRLVGGLARRCRGRRRRRQARRIPASSSTIR